MKAAIKYLFLFLFVVLVGEVIVVAPETLGRKDGDTARQFSEREQAATQKMERVHLIETTEGAREWDLRAETALTYRDTEDWQIEQVNATFFGKDDLTMMVTGEQGVVRVGTKDVEIKGNVRVRASNGYEFKSAKVAYASQSRTLLSETSVTMLGAQTNGANKMQLTGGGMKLDLNSGVINLAPSVKGSVVLTDKVPAKLSSDAAEFSAKSYRAVFSGNVLILYKALQVKGPKAMFNYDQDSSHLDSVDLVGGVRVSDVDKWASAQHVRILADQDRLVFRGEPKLVQENDELRGDEIVFLDGGNQVRVERGRARIKEEPARKVN